MRYARWAPRTSRAARAASYVSCVAPIARRSCKHMSAQNLRVEPMLAATCACSPHTALHFCCLSRPRTGRMLFSPCAQRIAYYAIHAERGGRCPCSALQPSGRLRAPRIPGNCSRPHRGGAVALVSVPLASTRAIGLCARSSTNIAAHVTIWPDSIHLSCIWQARWLTTRRRSRPTSRSSTRPALRGPVTVQLLRARP